MQRFIKFILLVITILQGCDKFSTTEDRSHVSYLPEFTFEGGEFISMPKLNKEDSIPFEDLDVTATCNGKEVQVYYQSFLSPDEYVDLTETGVYVIVYYAENDDGLSSTAERIVAVTNADVSKNDLSGIYEGTNWEPQVESKVRKIHEDGLYECDDVMGFPGFPVEGRFVDLGNNELILLHGDGFFGRYSSSEGSYSRSTLIWTIALLDAPYEGIDIPVLWRKNND